VTMMPARLAGRASLCALGSVLRAMIYSTRSSGERMIDASIFTLYCDDSGTHSKSDVAVAACYASTVGHWTHCKRNWG
jgi:hypothetical protein